MQIWLPSILHVLFSRSGIAPDTAMFLHAIVQASESFQDSTDRYCDRVVSKCCMPEPQAPIQQCPSGLKTLSPTAEGYVPQG